jgi:hypothetical protein
VLEIPYDDPVKRPVVDGNSVLNTEAEFSTASGFVRFGWIIRLLSVLVDRLRFTTKLNGSFNRVCVTLARRSAYRLVRLVEEYEYLVDEALRRGVHCSVSVPVEGDDSAVWECFVDRLY